MGRELDQDLPDWESLRAGLVQEATAALVHGWELIDDVSAAFAAAGDDIVTIQLGPDDDVVYVQARRDDDCWLVEAVSNTYLGDHVQLSAESEQWLTDHGWTAPSDDDEDDTPNFWRVYGDPVDFDEMARNIAVAFISAYGATPDSEFSVSPAIPPQDDDDEEPERRFEVHEGTGALERAARIAALPVLGWLVDDTLVAVASQNPLHVSWAMIEDRAAMISELIEQATRAATEMIDSPGPHWINTGEFRDALSAGGHPPALRALTELVAALPGTFQIDRLAQLLIMFGPHDAKPVVHSGTDEFVRIDVDDHVDDDAYVRVVEAAEGVDLDESWFWFIDQAILRSPAARRAAIRHTNAYVRARGHWVGATDPRHGTF